MKARSAKFAIGQVVKHRIFPFRGVIFDVDPEFDNTEEWWLSIPEEVRLRKDQPFYHLFAENDETEYIAFVSEQNLMPDTSGEPLRNARSARFSCATRVGATARSRCSPIEIQTKTPGARPGVSMSG